VDSNKKLSPVSRLRDRFSEGSFSTSWPVSRDALT
jgi:hypothetical protein